MNKREFFRKALVGIAMIPFLHKIAGKETEGEIGRVSVEPGDIIVIRIQTEFATEPYMDENLKFFKDMYPKNTVIILPDAMEFSVIKARPIGRNA